jgi:hypothetical protein
MSLPYTAVIVLAKSLPTPLAPIPQPVSVDNPPVVMNAPTVPYEVVSVKDWSSLFAVPVVAAGSNAIA